MQFFAAFGSAFYAFVAAVGLGLPVNGSNATARRSATVFNSLDVRGMTGPII